MIIDIRVHLLMWHGAVVCKGGNNVVVLVVIDCGLSTHPE